MRVQGILGLVYDISRNTWPTSVDLMEVILLISGATGLQQ